MNFIGLDIGSTSIKGVVWDLETLQISGQVVSLPCPAAVADLPARHFELDPIAVTTVAGQVLEQLSGMVDSVAGIVSCTQMAGVVLADAEGNPLGRYLSWRDQRLLDPHPDGSSSYFEVLQQRLSPKVLQQLGHECKLGSSPSLLFWLSEHGQLPEDGIPMILGDFIGTRLAGAEPVTEYTNALGAINLETGDWHREAFDKLGIDQLRWPRLCDPHTALGEISLGKGPVPWYPSVGDHQAALAGTLLAEGELSINISTGSQASMLSPGYQPGDYQVRPYFDRQYLNTLTHLPAGRSLNVMVDMLTELATAQGLPLPDPWPYILQQAAEARTDLEMELTFFSGPLGERGSIGNISLENLSVGPLFRAAFENMVDNFHVAGRRLSAADNWKRLVLSGGLARRSETLREMIASRFECPAHLAPGEEETMGGLLLLALVASGRAASVAAATRLLQDRDDESVAPRQGVD